MAAAAAAAAAGHYCMDVHRTLSVAVGMDFDSPKPALPTKPCQLRQECQAFVLAGGDLMDAVGVGDSVATH